MIRPGRAVRRRSGAPPAARRAGRDGGAVRRPCGRGRGTRRAGRASRGLLAEWDLEAREDSRGAAAIFNVWFERLRRLGRSASIWGGPAPAGSPRDALHEVLERRALPWVDRKRRQRCVRLAGCRAMLEADSIVAGRTRGASCTRCGHATIRWATVRLLDRMLRARTSAPRRVGGSPDDGERRARTAATSVPGRPSSYGASQRHVVDMADVDGSGGFILPTGQSGIPMSAALPGPVRALADGRAVARARWTAKAEARAVRCTYDGLRPAEAESN